DDRDRGAGAGDAVARGPDPALGHGAGLVVAGRGRARGTGVRAAAWAGGACARPRLTPAPSVARALLVVAEGLSADWAAGARGRAAHRAYPDGEHSYVFAV